jgi:hypothetical protein
MSKLLKIILPPNLYLELEDFCVEYELSKSAAARLLLSKGLESYGRPAYRTGDK